MKRNNWKSYDAAKEYVHKLKLTGKKPYADWAKTKSRPKNIPSEPVKVYKKEGTWISWGDWLGTGTIATYNVTYRSFEDARKFAQSLNLKNEKDWQKFTHSSNFPNNIPRYPDSTYNRRKDDYGGKWKGWGDFLGTGNVAKKQFLTFKEARKFIHELKLKNISEWHSYCKTEKLPHNIPRSPERPYKNEWISWGDWLGTGYVAHSNRKYRTFEDAKKFVQKLNIKSIKQWREVLQNNIIPDDIPHKPEHIYKKQGKWNGWGDFLGTGRVADMHKSKDWLPIREAKIEARRLAKELGIKSELGWVRAWKTGKIPKTLPREISAFYNPKRKREKKK